MDWRSQALSMGVDQNNPAALSAAGITPTAEPMNWGPVDMARQKSEGAQEAASSYAAGGNTLVDQLRKAIGERFAQSPIAGQAAQAKTDYLAAAPQARSEISSLIQGGAILSPTQQQQIMASKNAAALAPVLGTNVMQEAAFGTMEDLINAGTNAYNARTQELQGLAGIAQNSYSNILNELLQKAQEQRAQSQLQIALDAAAREAELFPLQKQTAQAQLANLLKGTVGGGTGTGGQYSDADIKSWTSLLIDPETGQIDTGLIDNIPADIRQQVLNQARQFAEQQAAQPSGWENGLNWATAKSYDLMSGLGNLSNWVQERMKWPTGKKVFK